MTPASLRFLLRGGQRVRSTIRSSLAPCPETCCTSHVSTAACSSLFQPLADGSSLQLLPQQLAFGSMCFSSQTSSKANSFGQASQVLPGAAGPRQHRLRAAPTKAGEQGLYLMALVISMVGITYASVPLYRAFCQATGFGGTVQQGSTVEAKLRAREENPDAALEAAATNCHLTVSFNANVVDGMSWKFKPTQRTIQIVPGQSALAFYTAHNTGQHPITGVSTYNVAPQQAGQYFNKIQCFCFEEQRLRPNEKVDMPVFFYVDPEFATDPKMRGIRHLTLSYTFFQVADEEAANRELRAHLEESRAQLPPSMRGPENAGLGAPAA